MPSRHVIVRFVREVLGCACPEEVFRSIELDTGIRLNSFITLRARIVVGNRLLIYVADAGSEACVEEHLPVLVRMGCGERDARGLNRFRLALVADTPDEVRQAAERLFGELRGSDGKMHLHVIPKSDVVELS